MIYQQSIYYKCCRSKGLEVLEQRLSDQVGKLFSTKTYEDTFYYRNRHVHQPTLEVMLRGNYNDIATIARTLNALVVHPHHPITLITIITPSHHRYDIFAHFLHSTITRYAHISLLHASKAITTLAIASDY
jgi:hypothetical protein